MKRCPYLFLLPLAVASLLGAGCSYLQGPVEGEELMSFERPAPNAELSDPNRVFIDAGHRHNRPHLTYGWSREEHTGGRFASWIKQREADVTFEWTGALDQPAEFLIEALPFFIESKQQVVGVYLNNHYVGRLLYPHDSEFHTFRLPVDPAWLQAGSNELTLRVGYTRRGPSRDRRLGLQVDWLMIRTLK